jgi:type VI secretion system secreted protein VgrG
MPVIQAHREVTLKSALAEDTLLFASMSGVEEIGRLFEFHLMLLSTDSDLKIADVLGKAMTIELAKNDQGDMRYFNGIVTRFICTGWSGTLAAYEATLHPWLWLLTRASNCRIYQSKTIPDIVKEVCSAYGGEAALSTDLLTEDYPLLTYCVQYRETDYAFVCRLLEDAGIYFFFTHDADRHTMHLADSYSAHSPIKSYTALKFSHAKLSRGQWTEESVSSWRAGGEIQSSRYVLNDFNFEKTSSSVSGGLLATANIAAGFKQQEYEMYDYPGKYEAVANGNSLARAAIERQHGQCERIEAQTNARGLHPGGLFTLADHPRDDQNRDYLITSTSYEFATNEYASGGDSQFVFACRLGAIGKEYPYRPPRTTPKPIVQGPQTAMVVGKAGEEIFTDKYGRVKVQFHWDRLGKNDENSSCWVRVAQGWAGKGWGAMAIPRIGMEVVVSFLEGDPDRPLITGCVYNSDSMPPYPLPGEQTKSTVKSNSSQGGDGFNEIRYEDKKGEEEFFVHAERDFNRVVKNNDTLKVGFDTANKGDQTIGIKNDQSLDIGNNQTVKVKVDQAINVGNTVVYEAGTSIELKVGASSVKIEAAKITLKSPEIEVVADANVKVKAGAMLDLNAGGILTVQGGIVKINQ